jgi:hypothetical protein
MSGTWSQRIERRFSLCLPVDVRAWLDESIWDRPGGAEFCRAKTPEQILEPEPGTIWAGFMMPDTVPLIGNDYGDWLCLRIAADGSVSEIIHWSHCGGDWIPSGRTLAESLLYDAMQRLLHPQRPQMVPSQVPGEDVFRLARWASQWVADGQQRVAPFWAGLSSADVSVQSGTNALDLLSRWQVAEFAVRRDRILRYLESPLKAASQPALAQRIGVSWEPDFVRWLFDTELVPAPHRQRLQHSMDVDGELFTQDWSAAEREAKAVIERRQDLGWAFDIAGWAAQRRGDDVTAVQHYLSGIRTSWFSDDTVQFRTHWFEEGYGKFAASRLATLAHHLTDQQRQDPYLRIFLDNDPDTLRQRVHQYWLSQAHRAERQGEPRHAYHCYYRAGWDLGLQPVTGYGEIFDGLRRTATAAGTPALAAVAQMHQQFLVNGAI